MRAVLPQPVLTRPPLTATAGLLALLLAMGIGRFGFTALLPQMRDDGLIDIGSAGVLAAVNYLGYLVGALGAALSRRADPARRLALGLVVSVATTLAMGVDCGLLGWCALRFASGVASAAVYVYTTGIVLRSLGEAGAANWSALHYMGVGAGIVVSARVAQHLPGGALAGWRGLGLIAAAAAGVVAWRLVPHGRVVPQGASATSDASAAPPLGWLAAAYGLAGFGYIVNATFLPTILRAQAGTADTALTGWLVVGLAAMPATAIWVRLSFRVGVYPTLIAATLIQAAGVALPVLVSGTRAAMTGAALLGGTFMGIAGLAQWLARVPDAQVTARRIGLITACYGVGQIVGPLLVAVGGPGGGFELPVLLAAGALVVSAALLEISRRRERLG